jgi:hypothetical protein
MQKPESTARAPREDLTGFTAEEKVERRRQRARVYSHYSRQRSKAVFQALQRDVAALTVRVWRLCVLGVGGGRAPTDDALVIINAISHPLLLVTPRPFA